MATYRYEPLPPVPQAGKALSFTRLMCLAPGTGDQALECTLITIDIANSPLEYEALSYVWGAKEPQVPIKCDGFNIPMTLNLRHALLALRHPTLPRPLWVDAICINQEDMDERARQVAYMRLVYQYADRVVVWLGQESAVIQRGLTRARELCEYRAMLNSTATDRGNSLQSVSQQANMQIDRILLESLIAETGSAEAASQSINDLVQLLETTYFERVWCIQEVVASKQCICQSGNVEFNFYDLLSLTALVNELGGPQKPYSPLRFWSQVYQQRTREWKPHALKVESSVGSMLQVLMNMRNFQATDPRDRLFAIFGITDEGLQPVLANMDALVSGNNARVLSTMQKAIVWLGKKAEERGIQRTERNPAMTPNYTKSVMEVYRDFTRFMMRKGTRLLDVLSHVQHTRDPAPSNSWPSWVPRFDELQSCTFFPARLFLPGIPLNGHYAYFAELHDSPLRGSPVEPNVLQLDGFRVDSVASVSGPVRSDEGGTLPIQRIWNDLFAFPLFPRTQLKYIGGIEQLDTAFFLTLCAGGTGLVTSMPDQLGQLGDRLQGLQTLAEHARNQTRCWLSASYGFPESAYPDLIPQSPAVREASLNPVYYHVGVWNFLHHRRVFRTQQGFLGLGPDTMKAGDQVVSLFGGHMAFVLRQVSASDWVLVGDCYLHHWDLMAGKLAELVRRRRVNIPTETFRLI
ncbi:heterokaryon incompatibility protein-domain-containing protein [Xylaria arbuscula]|nr:heterokaryon incompatibility protein-domain-containing protein [Xylaria arbuscula]